MFAQRSTRLPSISRNLLRNTHAANAKRPASSLVYIEHKDGKMNDSTLHAVTAAKAVGGDVSAIVVGTEGEVASVLDEVKKIDGLAKVFTAKSEGFAHGMAEVNAPALSAFLESPPSTASGPISHLFAAHTAVAKNIFPRLAGSMNVSHVADILSVKHDESSKSTEYTRPIYAGNAILQIKTSAEKDRIGVVSVRTTAFDKASTGGSGADVEEVKVEAATGPTKFISEELTTSTRPDLSAASRVVSGGRALKSADQFNAIMEPLADSLGAAIGASRAAVDAGYADNSLQVGQTGKVVAPELYVAVGISGAIQHLAGMKESKMIVAINKASRDAPRDADAPIFQIADAGLVADLFTAVPELTEKIKAAK
ncbi:Electron transfer flavoprotein alpha-subunit [Naganishia vaughanmartiniae]|uniref:Electron transfer flavoprotein alpha-subunit n=1 Tax=Naganishia vaughanmartiniae TaxID=1424756 RepID=A0ACC2WVE7_9TREE|nr:Electron transfer flavoprotein alpha-subunit [Naganishia vaughanmartiniae]